MNKTIFFAVCIFLAISASATTTSEPLFEFVKIEGGTYKMGSPESEKGRNDEMDLLPRRVIVEDFEIMTKEINQKQWFEVMENNPSDYKRKEHCQDHMFVGEVEMCPNNPVERVSMNDIQEFLSRINLECGKGGNCYRLPTEEEWEYAARAGTTTAYYFGNVQEGLDDNAWYYRNSNDKTHVVASKNANDWGLYDMYGNVEEWVESYPCWKNDNLYMILMSCLLLILYFERGILSQGLGLCSFGFTCFCCRFVGYGWRWISTCKRTWKKLEGFSTNPIPEHLPLETAAKMVHYLHQEGFPEVRA